MELRGKVSNPKAFVGKGGKQFFKADFEASNCELACTLTGAALDGVGEGEHAVQIGRLALRNSEWNGKVVVSMEAKVLKLSPVEGA
jgi:hypothetical protein